MKLSVLALDRTPAVALPITEEAGGELRLFTVRQRLIPHVRQREKYVDVPVTEGRAFVFRDNGRALRRTRTLRQFVEAVEHADRAHVAGYVQRGDVSRWIAEVLGDHALPGDLKNYEEHYRGERTADVVVDIANAIRSRYDLADGGPV